MRIVCLLCLLPAAVSAADSPSLANRWTRVQAVGAEGRVVGFGVFALTGVDAVPVAEVRWCSAGRWSCRTAQVADGAVRFGGFDTAGTGGTPALSDDTAVTVRLAADDPYPQVSFRFGLTAFDEIAWRRSWTNLAPVYFLRCSLPATADPQQMFYQGGILYPGPEIDPYPIASGPMRGQWAPRWSYSIAVGANPVPAVGLWSPASRLLAAYEFQGARGTDRSDLPVASAYCAGLPDHPGQFLCLSTPHAGQWLNLRLPDGPTTVASRFRLLYQRNLPASDDPNRFILRHLLERYREALPPAPRMNDMSWLRQGRSADQLRFLHDLGLAGDYPRQNVAPRLYLPFAQCEQAFFEPGAVQLIGHQTGKYARYAWEVGDTAGLQRLKAEIDHLVACARTERFGDDVCFVWPHPLEGTFKKAMGGAAATTTRHMFNWAVGSAMLSFYRHQQGGAYLPFLDGLVKWTRHYLYDRAGMADLPWAVFSMGAGNGGEFLWDYADTFAEDPQRRALAAEARALAEVVIYRNLYAYTSDPDASDAFDPSFLLQAVNSNYWCGAVTWGEMGRIPEMAIQLYLENGDPYLAWLVRGCLERYHVGTVSDDGSYTENLGVFGETIAKGALSGGWGGNDFRWLAEPLGGAIVQVDVGPKGALAFGHGTQAVDITDYAYAAGPTVAFTLTVDASLPGAPTGEFAVQVTSPRRSLTGATVRLDGQVLPADRYRIGAGGRHALVRGVRAGQRVQIGGAPEPPRVALAPYKVRQAWDPLPAAGFNQVDLRRWATAPVAVNWRGPWGGLAPGPKVARHLAYTLLDPAANRGLGAVPLRDGIRLPVAGAAPVALIIGATPTGDAPFPPVRVTLQRPGGGQESLVLNEADGLAVDQGSEWYEKTWRLRAYVVGQAGQAVDGVTLAGDALLFAVSLPTSAVGQAAAARFVESRQSEQRQERLAQAAAAYRSWQTPLTRAAQTATWADPQRPYRFLVRLDPVQPRQDAIVTLREAFDGLLAQIGERGALAPGSLRAWRCDAAGRPQQELAVQFLPDTGRTDRGDLAIRLPGEWREPVTIAVHFTTTATPAAPAAESLSFRLDGPVARFGSGAVSLAFNLSGQGTGPRLTELSWGRGNELAKAGWDEGYGHLCACQDGVTWYDFGALQDSDAVAEVVERGPLAMTVRVSHLAIYGQGGAVSMTGVGSPGRTKAGLKGQASWYFRLYASDPRVDCWVESTIDDPLTAWTRPLEVRFGPRDATNGRSLSGADGPVAAACRSFALAVVRRGPDEPAYPAFTGQDGAVLNVSFANPQYPGRYRSGRWRILPPGGSDAAIAGEASAPMVEQFAVERRTGERVEQPAPRPWTLADEAAGADWLARLPKGEVRTVTIGQPDEVHGLRVKDNRDEGVSLRDQHAGRWHLAPAPLPNGGRQGFFYFALDPPAKLPATGGRAYVAVEYYDRGSTEAELHYDSADASVTKSVVPGAFKDALTTIHCTNTRQWRTHLFALPDARFAGGCNGADLRLQVKRGQLWIGRVAVVLVTAKP